MTDRAGSTTPGTPYKMRFTDEFGNVGKLCCLFYSIHEQLFESFNYIVIHIEIRNVDRPQVILDFFRNLNGVDSHNHARQFELALEKMGNT